MLSRMADSLYWLSRYTERAENLARILDVAQRLSQLPSAYAGASNEWESAIATASCKEVFDRSYPEATRENVIRFLVGTDGNPNSIIACIETARTNARAVRTTITTEMWEIINDGWNEMRRVRVDDMTPSELAAFLAQVKQLSLRFDGAAYRTMLRTDHYWFQRLGTFIERSDNMARLLDVKYHILLPEKAPVGGSLDYFQWAAILRSVNALTSFHWVYRKSVQPWLVADLLIFRPEQPRSLVSCYKAINEYLDQIADAYGRQGPAQRIGRTTLSRLSMGDIDTVFQSGLHEFLDGFIKENNALGAAISQQYLS
ncbi:MAG TPA: alpha-E domain-containing protein [Hyphomicrobiaceae bacterium]|nr:alpha-E domain-containing protein [Hyphomicrobiaceae bacterium]